ncbi:MAG: ATP synthase F1 subunit delta [Candidatus Moranbacteria bacterium CG06_land_8_20_14_3_00_43_56]|nr:MAG: ATP synthase F1 subunit delta [Candidatus Moranbacteria bacterium CG06_land_8_20_14_3_00_43_56]PIV83466.1 MAG: ATP synthase F1 subunit delta [Candidatus Moranbacteria bacterium CG17_big_fil_post_rev_8_21_14_2_50_44_12]PIW92878.1 MAG: ATP synthase F1 subunit delta [Candidatus Moranbacteria bacterium CG_4_8_14_3_um_filter_43_15]PJA86035.1 MAG: ATP synthase F1 subunit delta [Candidatus Moranbacteria bacterium CG_4_9_14_3_um_filter_44_28]
MRITPKQFAQTLYDFTDKKSETEVEKSVGHFAEFIIKDRKLKLADKIIEQFGKVYNQKKGIVEAEVITRKKMDESLAKEVKYFVKEKYGAKEVIINNIIDESVKGGVIIKVEDEVRDGSVRGKLGELKKILAN